MMQSEISHPVLGKSPRREHALGLPCSCLVALWLSLALVTRSQAQVVSNSIASYDKAIEKQPTNASLYDRRGWAYGTGGDLEKAIADFTQAIRLNPQDAA